MDDVESDVDTVRMNEDGDARDTKMATNGVVGVMAAASPKRN